MSLLPDLSTLTDSLAFSSLKFSFAELQVLLHALRVYHGYLDDEESESHKQFYCDDGSLEYDVCQLLYDKIINYSYS